MTTENKSNVHYFDIDDAIEYDIETAVILNNFRYWLRTNKAENRNIHDGRVWTYNTLDGLENLFPYISRSAIYRRIQKLEEDGVILKDNFNKNSYDRTVWYSVNEEEFILDVPYSKSEKSIFRNEQMDITETKNGYNDHGTTIPDNNPDINKNNKQQDINKHDHARESENFSIKNTDDIDDAINSLREHFGEEYDKVISKTIN